MFSTHIHMSSWCACMFYSEYFLSKILFYFGTIVKLQKLIFIFSISDVDTYLLCCQSQAHIHFKLNERDPNSSQVIIIKLKMCLYHKLFKWSSMFILLNNIEYSTHIYPHYNIYRSVS